ncbi:MAG: DegV family protein, partial [Lachnospiraceae bacterium]|nr:DegV family protein [Lachnospiraceae bacterium]
MRDFRIFTDSTTDLPAEFYEKYDIPYISLRYTIDGETFDDNHTVSAADFYNKMRNGSTPTTTQPSPEIAEEFIRNEIAKKDTDILFIAFSSGLSGTYNSVSLAANNIMEEDPSRKIIVIDSLAASTGEGLIVYKALQYKNAGHTLEETAKYVEDIKLHAVHVFTVDDLNSLHRGGRVSKGTAIVGTLANIKPLLHTDDEGHLTSVGMTRGRKKSLIWLVDSMEKQMGSYRDQNDTVFICNGDCIDDANFVKEQVMTRFGIENVVIADTGPVIGAVCGLLPQCGFA